MTRTAGTVIVAIASTVLLVTLLHAAGVYLPVAAGAAAAALLGTFCAPPLRLVGERAHAVKQWQIVAAGVTTALLVALTHLQPGVAAILGISVALGVGAVLSTEPSPKPAPEGAE